MSAGEIKGLVQYFRTTPLGELLLSIGLFTFPIMTLTVKGGANTAFALVALISILIIAKSGFTLRELLSDRQTQLFALAMSAGAVTIAINQLAYLHFDPHPFDSELRFLLAFVIFVALRLLGARVLTLLEYAFPAAALAALTYIEISYTGAGRLRTQFLNPIHVGGIALVLAMLSLYSINWLKKDSAPLQLFKLSGFLAGIYIVIGSGTRGAWIALPILLLIWLTTFKKRLIGVWSAILLMSALLFLAYNTLNVVQYRINWFISNLDGYAGKHVDSGTAARVELWKAALKLAKDNPIVGIEPESINDRLTELHEAGEINSWVLYVGKAEMHSEVAARVARYGLLGVFALLAASLLPGWLFYRELALSDRTANGAARMGLSVVVAFFIFGLTLENYNIKMVAAFYSLTVAILLAATTMRTSPISEEDDVLWLWRIKRKLADTYKQVLR